MRNLVLALTIGCALFIVRNPQQACAQTGFEIYHTPWYEMKVDSTSIQFHWKNSTSVIGEVWMGTDSNRMTMVLSIGSASKDRRPIVHGLTPATMYFVKLVSTYTGYSDTVRFWTSTASDYRSTGAIQVYFNRDVDTTTYPFLPHAHGNADFMGLLRNRILNAKNSIDLALYSFGDRVGDSVAKWLIVAKDKGISVRLIVDSGSSKKSQAFQTVRSSGIPAITNGFGASGRLWSNIHHNKFIIFDGRGKDSVNDGANAWVQTGSWNLTDQQTTTDFQNLVYVQDLALAHAYEREFEEEWGSATDTPDSAASRFSTRKTDNTPRSFNIGGREVHLFFSPGGGIPQAIDTLLDGSAGPILLSMYDFTSQDLEATLINAQNRGAKVHGIIGMGGSYDQTPLLVAAGCDVIHYSGYLRFDTLFHHKYCILDPNTADGWVLTGSFNWTHSADTLNNENILLIRDRDISAEYFEEWLARYQNNGGEQTITLNSSTVRDREVVSKSLGIYPNPAQRAFEIEWNGKDDGPATISIRSILGQMLQTKRVWQNAGKNSLALNLDLPSGSYGLLLEHDGSFDFSPLHILR